MTQAREQGTAPVSVVIPCYRCSPTIGRALQSVAAQSTLPFEVILVDDGSRDGTVEELKALAAKHPPGWIRILEFPENRGAADARNAGWDNATQQYVAFLDADDAWHPRKIELQYGYMAAHSEVAVCGHGYAIAGTAKIPTTEINELTAEALSRLSLLLSNRLVTPSVMVKRDLLYRFPAGRRHVDDHLLWLQVHCAGLRVVRLCAPLAYVYKAMYGERGLSAELWEMEKAELENYWILRRQGCIGLPATLALGAYSFAKFLRRVLLVIMRRAQRLL